MGVGTPRGEQTPQERADYSLDWIDRYCFYRSYREIEHAFAAFEILLRLRSRPGRPTIAAFGPQEPGCDHCFREGTGSRRSRCNAWHSGRSRCIGASRLTWRKAIVPALMPRRG
jgi:hypothetical protein